VNDRNRRCPGAREGILRDRHGIAADMWSVTSYTELRWDELAGDHASAAIREVCGLREGAPWVMRCLRDTQKPIVAASDYVVAVVDLIRPWVPAGRSFTALGTDGFGRSDTRARLRKFFGVDRDAVVGAVLR
jgi:pyruvate dehydrogenase E1 component